MKHYLTNTIIKHKNEYIDSLFYIKSGIVLEEKTKKQISENNYLFLENIFQNEFCKSNYIAKTKVVGLWIPFDELDDSIKKVLSNEIFMLKKHNELLMIQDPLIKITRYLYYEYETKKTYSFYIPAMKELSKYLNISLKHISFYINLLINKKIISKHNKLINILNIKSLEDYAFLLDL